MLDVNEFDGAEKTSYRLLLLPFGKDKRLHVLRDALAEAKTETG